MMLLDANGQNAIFSEVNLFFVNVFGRMIIMRRVFSICILVVAA